MYFLSSIRKLLALLFATTIGASAFSRMNQSPQAEIAAQFLKKWMGSSDDLVYTECGNRFGNFETLLKRAFVWKYISLSSIDKRFRTLQRTNSLNNIRTVVVAHTITRNHSECTGLVKRVLKTMPLADVIVFNDVHDLYGQFQDRIIYRGRYKACKIASTVPNRLMKQQIKEKGLTSESSVQTIFSQKCFSLQSRHSNKWISSLPDSVLVLGCRRTPRLGPSETTCDDKQFHLVRATLWHFNVTLKFRVYGDFYTISRDFGRGDVDVLLNLYGLDERTFRIFAPPQTFTFGYETFYAWKGKVETSFFRTVQHSPQAIGYSLLTMFLCWLALSFGHYLETSGNIDPIILVHFATFLIASFLSTSATVSRPLGSATNYRRLKFQTAIIALWMVGIFPLSFYLRGELISRLSVKLPPNPVDTIQELEEALDADQLMPCIVKEGLMSHLLINRSNLGTVDRLYGKLKAGFQLKRNGLPREFPNHRQCLHYCATKPGYACFMYDIEDCPAEMGSAEYVKSKEHFKLVLSATPVRKDLEQANDYGKLQRRIFETALNAHDFNSPRRCRLQNTGRTINSSGNSDVQGKESSQVFALSVFFATFCAALLFATIALAIECTLARNT